MGCPILRLVNLEEEVLGLVVANMTWANEAYSTIQNVSLVQPEHILSDEIVFLEKSGWSGASK